MPSSTPTPASSDVDATRLLTDRRERLGKALAAFDERRTDAVAVIEAVGRAIAGGGKVVTCGNGGSAAEALHLAEELVGRYRSNRPAIPAICLNADPTALTCIANDFGFDEVFARQCEALLDARDVLVVFTTSGRSANLLRALDMARTRGATTVGFLGGDGGPALDRCDASVVIPGPDSAAIQEVHQMLMHAVCEQFESAAPLQPMP